MKTKISKILGVGVTLALLTSLLLTAVPVSALSMPEVTVDAAEDEISFVDADYAIFFTILEEINQAAGDTITITFPDDTVIDVMANIIATIEASPGWIEGLGWNDAILTTPAFTSSPDDRTITCTLDDVNDAIGESASIRIEITDGITNPTTPDDYILTVETSQEDAVDSEVYTIDPPDIAVPAGVVRVFNPSGIEFQPQTGNTAISDAVGIAGEDWLIMVGEGRYIGAIADTGAIKGLTIKAATGADVVIANDMVMNGIEQTLEGVTFEDGSLNITAADIVVDGCTFTGDASFIDVDAACEITDCTLEVAETFTGVLFDTAAADVTGCNFTIEDDSTAINATAAGGTVVDCTFTGGSGDGIILTGDTDVTGCTFDGLDWALQITGGTQVISGNTIQACDEIAIDINAATDVAITGNILTGNDEAVLIEVALNGDAEDVQIMFNDIVSNAGDDDGLLISNLDVGVDLNCVNNWWGDPDGPGDDAFSADVLSAPFLTASVGDTGVLGTNVAVNTMWDERDTVGVTIESTDAGDMEIVGAAQYAANPGAAIADGTALIFWDVCVIDTTAPADVTEVSLRLYFPGVTADTEARVWAAARGEWLECSDYTPNLFGGFVGITIDDTTIPTLEDLGELPFVLVEPPAAAAVLTAPVIVSPESGSDGVTLKPTLAWEPVDDAVGYDFQLADNPVFVLPLVSLTGDMGRLTVPFYARVTEFDYSTYYYWRVKAVGADGESAWSPAVFMTMAEVIPEPEPEVVWTCPQCGLTFDTREALDAHFGTAHPVEEPPEIIIESPDIVVPLPAETPITPGWIYAIIGVGAVLVIAVIVLIVRTRRVA